MIWALLAFVGVPLWLCVLGILAVVYRNRALRSRHGDIPVRVLRPGKTRWTRGHAVWVSDVFAWRGSPAAWNEYLELILGASVREATTQERKRLHGLGDALAVATLTTEKGVVLRVATAAEHWTQMLGPFVTTVETL